MCYITKTAPKVTKYKNLIKYKTAIINFEEYFIVGKCLSGSRHYSEIFSDYQTAIEEFGKYCGMVSYFGGGVCELYAITNNEIKIIESQVCF